MKTKSTTLSIDPVIKERALFLNQVLGFRTFSGLVTYLINEKYKQMEELVEKI